jgi:predicted metal-dependent RNase
MVRAPLDSTEKYVAVTHSSSDQNFTNFVKQIQFRPMKILLCYGQQLNIWTVVLTT